MRLGLAALAIQTATAQGEDTVLAVPPDKLAELWVPSHAVTATYPIGAKRRWQEGCATVGFVIEPDGTTSSLRVLASWPGSEFESPSLEAARKHRYEPAPGNPGREAVYTTHTFTFQVNRNVVKEAELKQELALACLSRASLAGGSG